MDNDANSPDVVETLRSYVPSLVATNLSERSFRGRTMLYALVEQAEKTEKAATGQVAYLVEASALVHGHAAVLRPNRTLTP